MFGIHFNLFCILLDLFSQIRTSSKLFKRLEWSLKRSPRMSQIWSIGLRSGLRAAQTIVLIPMSIR